MNTPLRRLDGITYWVIEDPDAIADFLNTEVRKEWEDDVKTMPEDPAAGLWLGTLRNRKWRLEIVSIRSLTLDEKAMAYVDSKTGYNFAQRLSRRREELRKGLETWGHVIWPIVVRADDMQILDGYCRYTTLLEMGIQRLYAYVGRI